MRPERKDIENLIAREPCAHPSSEYRPACREASTQRDGVAGNTPRRRYVRMSAIRSLTLARDVPIMASTVYGSHTVSIRRKDSEKEPSSPVMTVVW